MLNPAALEMVVILLDNGLLSGRKSTLLLMLRSLTFV